MNIWDYNDINNKSIIQVIYLKLIFIDNNILELENLLIKCQHLIGLYLIN